MLHEHAVKFMALALLTVTSVAGGDSKPAGKPSLWNEPTDIRTRDLFFGQGGREQAPSAEPFVFVQEDKDGNSPKFVVRDGNGVKWKVKLGREARPETVVTRLVWAVGYATDEDYFLPRQQVIGMPVRLSRGAEFVDSDLIVHDARWERMDHTKVGNWKWSDNPFKNTRELNGLRVLMSMFNNYDMKDSQNSVYEKGPKDQYVVSDLGATLGPTGSKWPMSTGRGELATYEKSDFIKKINKDSVDFAAPSWPMMFGVLPLPPLPYNVLTYPFTLLGLPKASNVTQQRWIGKGVPIEDVRWMAGLLKQLSPEQIRSAFKAAHYTPEQVEGFSREIERRIAELNQI